MRSVLLRNTATSCIIYYCYPQKALQFIICLRVLQNFCGRVSEICRIVLQALSVKVIVIASDFIDTTIRKAHNLPREVEVEPGILAELSPKSATTFYGWCLPSVIQSLAVTKKVVYFTTIDNNFKRTGPRWLGLQAQSIWRRFLTTEFI